MMIDEFKEISEMLDKLADELNSLEEQNLTKESQQKPVKELPMTGEINKLKTYVATMANKFNELYNLHHNLERRLLNVEGTIERLLSGK